MARKSPVAKAAPKTIPAVAHYSQTRNKFRQMDSFKPPTLSTPLFDTKGGLYQSKEIFNQTMTSRFSGFEKLFYTLAWNVVEDPDYALNKDWRVYDRMRRDPQIYYCLNVRKSATSGLPWTIVPPAGYENNEQAIAMASETEMRMKRIPRFSTLLDNILDALLPGMSVNELIWEVDSKGNYVIKQHYPVNKDRFRFDREGQIRLLTPAQSWRGVPVPPYKFVVHQYNVSDGSWRSPEQAGYVYFGRGLADMPLYHYFFFKITILKFYLQSLERAGNPAKILYTGSRNPDLQSKLSEIMLALKNDSVCVIPGSKEEISVDALRVPLSKGQYLNALEYIDRLITRAILGQDLMTENIQSTGSRAAATVHKSVFGWIAEEDKNLLQHTINSSIMKYDATLNLSYLPLELRPVFRFKQAAVDDAAAYLATVQTAQELGLSISKSQLRDLTGLKEPTDEADTLEPVQQPMMPMSEEEKVPPTKKLKDAKDAAKKKQKTKVNKKDTKNEVSQTIRGTKLKLAR